MFDKSHRGRFARAANIRACLLLGVALEGTAAFAQTPAATTAAAADDTGLTEIIVTAERRSENLQKVPVAIVALGTQKLAQLQVQSFNDYAKFLPSLSFDSVGPGTANVYFRGVASGGDGNHSGPLPSVGQYLDEQPITTIGGTLDIHVYDIARVEALAGPQGTLYGASSQAGTIRIITNKPELGKFKAGYDLELNKISKGGVGGVAEAFINAPLTDNTALRVVGWYDRDAGYIDNIPSTRTYPISGFTIDNKATAKNNYNTVSTVGARALLRMEFGDWSITPGIMGQSQISNGNFSVKKGLPDLTTAHYYPENAKDNWFQASLTIEGKISDFDLTYAGSYLERRVDSQSDYTDYTVYYDNYSKYILDNAGHPINPSQRITGHDRFSKMSHELRISSPTDKRLRLIAGAFYQRQTRVIEQNYFIDGLTANQIYTIPVVTGTNEDGTDIIKLVPNAISVTGHPDTWWLTKQYRIDRDYALFGQVALDIVDGVTLTAGGRVYRFDNSLIGFFGFGKNNPVGSDGENSCFGPATTEGAPCTDLGDIDASGKITPKRSKGTGFIHKLNLAWQINPDILVYGTWSRGYRPGGINRRGTLPPYAADFLTNYEAGFKGSFLDRKVRFNGAIFQEEWKAVQLAFLGQNGLTEIQNAGNARIRGAEGELTVIPVNGLTLTASGSYTDAHLTTNYCRIANSPDCSLPDAATGKANFIRAPIGQALPVTPDFKGNLIARYEWEMNGGYKMHLQGAAAHIGSRWAALRTDDREALGKLPAYTTVDFTLGAEHNGFTAEIFARNAFDSRGVITRFAQCSTVGCAPIGTYDVVVQPATFGVRFGQRF